MTLQGAGWDFEIKLVVSFLTCFQEIRAGVLCFKGDVQNFYSPTTPIGGKILL